MRYVFIICVVLSLLTIVIVPSAYVGYLGWEYTHPSKKPIDATPKNFGLGYQDISFPSRDQAVELRGWLIQAPNQNGRIVIFAHGYKENRESATVALEMAGSIHHRGIASLLFDFRASGESDGDMTSFGYHEQDDLIGAIQYAKSLGYKRIALVGFSMGAATALEVAPEIPEVEAIIADSAYTDLDSYLTGNLYHLHEEYGLVNEAQLQRKFADAAWFQWASNLWRDHAEQVGPVLAAVMPKFVLWEVGLLTGIQPKHVQPIAAVSHLTEQAVFLIHSEEDPIVPASESMELDKACSCTDKMLWLSKSTNHVGTYQLDPREYLRRTTEFLSFHLQDHDPSGDSESHEADMVWSRAVQ